MSDKFLVHTMLDLKITRDTYYWISSQYGSHGTLQRKNALSSRRALDFHYVKALIWLEKYIVGLIVHGSEKANLCKHTLFVRF